MHMRMLCKYKKKKTDIVVNYKPSLFGDNECIVGVNAVEQSIANI